MAVAASTASSAHRRVIFASSLGTLFEWYDFFLYGSLSAVIARQFFSGVNETTGFIFALLAFAAGAFVRPLGGLVFGRLGDLVGRKYTFLITIVLMGSATFLVGCLPSYAAIGIAAPITLITLRLLQGLALGGEYGGAAVYVAEHAPAHLRGRYTSWIQVSAPLGLLLSLLVIVVCRLSLGEGFERFGWRIPFLVSIVLLAVSTYIRLQLNESPVFREMKAEGSLSRAPLAEAFGTWANGKVVILVLLVTAGQAVTAYAAQLYPMFFLEKILKVSAADSSLILAGAILLASPFYVGFGTLSDRIGRKPIIMCGCLLCVLTYFPLFRALTYYGNPALASAIAAAPVTVVAPPAECALQFDPVGDRVFASPCDVAKSALTRAGIPYQNDPAPSGTLARVRIGSGPSATYVDSVDVRHLSRSGLESAARDFGARLSASLAYAGYPLRADPAHVSHVVLTLLVAYLLLIMAMTYAPLAAWLVELFPARIRYTSLSLPYHIANGWFGGFLPAVSFTIVAATGDIYSGLWYPVTVAFLALVSGTLFLRETRGRPLPV